MDIREATADDLPFLKQMLYEAALWGIDGDEFPLEQALALPQLAVYHEGWGRQGDVGLIAEQEGVPIGAVYYRLYTEEVHAHGYVDDDTPELSIGVVAEHHGKGVGRALMEAIHDAARRAGIERMALSVDPRNPARRLYASLGYEDFHPDDGHQRMILDL